GGTAEREASEQVSRTGLIFRKTAHRVAAASIEALRERDRIGRVRSGRNREGGLDTDLSLAREHEFGSETIISGIVSEPPIETRVRAESFACDTQIDRVVDACVRIYRIVTPVMNQIE